MARLTTRARKALPRSDFALPKGTKASKAPAFPLTDASHDRNAISGATRSLRAGNITKAQAETVKRKARAALKRTKGR